MLFVTAVLTFAAVAADEPKGGINFKNAPLSQVLPIYQALSGYQLVESSDVKKLNRTITLETPATLSKAETLKLMEKALLEQAGVVITRLDDKRASVTVSVKAPADAAKP